MEAVPVESVLFRRKSLSLFEVEAILRTPPANVITDPPVNAKGDDVYLYKALNAIREGNLVALIVTLRHRDVVGGIPSYIS